MFNIQNNLPLGSTYAEKARSEIYNDKTISYYTQIKEILELYDKIWDEEQQCFVDNLTKSFHPKPSSLYMKPNFFEQNGKYEKPSLEIKETESIPSFEIFI